MPRGCRVNYSSELDNAIWTKVAASIRSNAVIAPNGTLSADRILENTANSGHYTEQRPTIAASTTYTASWYVKAGERTMCNFENYSYPTTSIYANVRFDLSTGAFTAPALGGGATITATAENKGNGWWRVCLVITLGGSDTQMMQRCALHNGTTTVYTGDGYSGIYIWGAQLEAGAFPTSYIPTTSAQVTRAADAASMTGTNFSSWYRQAEGTFAFSAIPNAVTATQDSTSRVYLGVGDSALPFANGNTMYFSRGVSSLSASWSVLAGGTAQYSGAGLVTTQGAAFTAAFGYKLNDFAATLNAGTASTDTNALVPPVLQLAIGGSSALWSGASSGNNINGHIKKIAYYPKRLSNSQLQSITT